MSEPKSLLGRLAVHHKLITMEQLAEATRVAGGGGQRLGQVLVQRGWLSPEQLDALVQKQREIVAQHRAKQAAAQANASPEAQGADANAARAAALPPTPPRDEAAAAAPKRAAAPYADLDTLLRDAVERGASDVHLHAGAAARFRIHGVLTEAEAAPLEAERCERLVRSALGEREARILDEHGEVDLSYSVEGIGRFRTNVYRQQRGCDGIFHHIPAEPPTLEGLSLPSELARFTNYHQGMVLVTGPAGCGKSSTLAALVNLVNEERKEHILTIEEPIEYVHSSKRCLVNQRSVQRHTESFARALRAALREDPDVIVIGELRDLETISLALSAAETGHLVLGTLHTDGAIRTINRIVGAFPSNQQNQVRTMVSESLRAVVTQKLVLQADGNGRLPALETLVVTRAVSNLIRENKTFQIQSILQTGAAQGMCMMDDSLRQLVQSGAVAKDEALRHCEDPKRLGG